MLSVNIIGTSQIQNKLQNKVNDRKIEETLDSTALKIENDAKHICPVDTGRLRASVNTKKCGSLCRSIGTSVEYAPYVEFGTRRMQAQPFLRPALHKNIHHLKDLTKK